MDRTNNELLVVRSQLGDLEAFAELVRAWQEPLWYFVYRYCCSQTTAWDIITEAWGEIIKQLPFLGDTSDFPDWAMGIAFRKCSDWHNSQQLPSGFAGEYADAAESLLTGDEYEEVNIMETAISELDHDRRAMLTLYYHPEYDISRIGRIFSISTRSVTTRVEQSLNELKSKVEMPQGGDLENMLRSAIENMRPFNAKIAGGVNADVVNLFDKHQNKTKQFFLAGTIASLSVLAVGAILFLFAGHPKLTGLAILMIMIGLNAAVALKLFGWIMKKKLQTTREIKQLQLKIAKSSSDTNN